MDPTAISGELLTRHSAFFRGLARGMLGDEQLAEDACQEAVLATLRKPPPSHVNPVAWLATLTRRAALAMRRSGTRRASREFEVARPEAQPSTVDALGQAELLLRVAEAVMELPEPYRATLLARYYEELTPTSIAARDRLALATVKSRITRAHALLRERLDRTSGKQRPSWQSELAAVCGLPSAPLLVPVIAMNTSVKLGLVAAAVLAGASAGWLVLSHTASRASPESKPLAVAGAVLPGIELPQDAPVETARAVVPPEIASTAEQRVLLWGDIHGATLEELREGSLEFVDALGVSRKASLGSPASYSAFGLARGTYRAIDSQRGFLPLDEEIVIPGGQAKVRHDLEYKRSLVLPVKFVDSNSGELLTFPYPDPIGVGLSVAATLTRPERIENVLSRRVYRSDGGFFHVVETSHFADPLIPKGASGTLEVFVPTPIFASLVLRGIVLESRSVTGLETELVFSIDRSALESKLGALSLRCVDAYSQAPIPGQTVEVSFADSTGGGQGRTNAAGEMRIERLTPGMRRVNLRGSGFAAYESWVCIEPGAELDLGAVELYPTATVSGHLVDPSGAGVSAPMATICLPRELSPRNAQALFTFRSSADGRFEMAGAEAARLRLVAQPQGWALAAWDIDATSGKADKLVATVEKGNEVLVRAPRESKSLFEFQLADSKGLPLLLSSAYGPTPRRILLKSGQYRLSRVVEDRILWTDTIDVVDSTEPLTVELH